MLNANPDSNCESRRLCRYGWLLFYFCVKIKGSVLTDYFIADEAKLGYELGQHLATLHEGLKEITPKLTDLWDNDMLQELSGWVSEELETYVSASTLPKTELTELKT